MIMELASTYKTQKSDQSKSNCGVTVSKLTWAKVMRRVDIFK